MNLGFRQYNKSLADPTKRVPLQPRAPTMFQPPKASFGIPPSKSNPIATHVAEDDCDEEEVNVPEFRDDNAFMSAGEAEKALRDLMSGGTNQELDADVEVDMSQAIVDGFKPGIKLLPHQVLGRAWMKDREDVTKKRAGGILADDMGYFNLFRTPLYFSFYFDSLGKTIQTLTRIVDGRARKSDKADGWSASTL